MKHFLMSPVTHIKIKSGKPHFVKPVQFKLNSTWENFRSTQSVGRFTVLKTVETVKNQPKTMKTVKVETRFGVTFREATEKQHTIIAYGIIHTKRSDGVFRESGVIFTKKTAGINGKKKVQNNTSLDVDKTVEFKGKIYHIIKHK